MKNLTLTIVLVFCTFLAKAQIQDKNFDNIINFGLPSYLYKPSNSKISDFIKNRTHLFYELSLKHAIFYTHGEILVKLWATNTSIVKNNELEEEKKFNDYINAQGTGTTNYSSEIKIINNAKVLIVYEERSSDYSSYYISAINSNSKKASVRIDYKLNDKAAAQEIADTILANLRFVEAPLQPGGWPIDQH